MKLKDCLTRLAVGEISNTAYADNLYGTIKEGRVPVVVRFIQDALDKLYTKFYLRIENVYLEIYEGRTDYTISSKHLMDKSLTATTDKYLWKTDNDSLDELLKIYEVATVSGEPLPINDKSDLRSVYTPFYNVLQVPVILDRALVISYIAKHKALDYKDLDQEIELPDNLFPALYYYVAYQVHSNINTQEAVANAQKYLSMYQSAINDVIESDLANPMYPTNHTKFIKNGWC